MGMRLSITMNMNTEKEMINQEITSKISTSMASKAQHKKHEHQVRNIFEYYISSERASIDVDALET